MIGKSLRERHTLSALPRERAIAVLREVLDAQAASLVSVRAQDSRMIACLVVQADEATVRLCRSLGFRLKRGATAVFGLLGDDVIRLLAPLAAQEGQRAWLEAPCSPRETKVLLLAGGTAMLSVETHEGRVAITAVP